ncbi:TAT-variant-translocated molybdopterin oxidoreductase [Lysinibacillus contaminans]|uniref:TAT-variant-translocated molybdopterin oxidoreductase n=1 Tax=Lysinibacillus contaminans TaxID=1293441 RepID=UPI003CCC134A
MNEFKKVWLGLKLIEDDEEVTEFLHDEFFSTYQGWKELKKTINLLKENPLVSL